MKRYLLIIMAAFASVLSFAQSYQPMLKDGRVWVTMEYFSNEEYSNDYAYTVYGDTIIDERAYKKVHRERLIILPTTYSMPTMEKDIAMYEEDRKVYFYNDTDKKPQLLLDFSLHKGDEVSADGSRIIAEDSINVLGNKFRRLVLNTKFYDENVCWVEGIGPNFISFETTGSTTGGSQYCIMTNYCDTPDEPVFSQEDFSKEPFYTGIHAISADQRRRTSGIYDISGRQINAPQKGEVYIKDGRKHVEK